MRTTKPYLLSILFAGSIAGAAAAQAVTAPTAAQARRAVVKMFGDPPAMKSATVKVGTCVPTTGATQKGEVACTFALLTSGGSSESQANFYPDAGGWTAEPTEQQGLPFPDPKLRE
jgi:hypothetical protein